METEDIDDVVCGNCGAVPPDPKDLTDWSETEFEHLCPPCAVAHAAEVTAEAEAGAESLVGGQALDLVLDRLQD